MRTIQQWREIVNEAKSDRALAQFVLSDLVHYQNRRAHEGEDLVSLSNLFACLFEDSTRQTHWTARAEAEEA